MTQSPKITGERQYPKSGPSYILHPSFLESASERQYREPDVSTEASKAKGHLENDVTLAYARCMHYAGYRAAIATSKREQERWIERYYHWRDKIVEGNLKLIFRAVNRWMPKSSLFDEMLGNCQIVFIQAVAVYNPWIGVRFSTYTFTCLMRAMSRQSKKYANDRLSNSLSLDIFPEGEPNDVATEETPETKLSRVLDYVHDRHPLLSDREKQVLIRRFSLDGDERTGTLAQVGAELGLSKERVRQVQIGALDKIRDAMEGTTK